jgi:hypothetical protein
MDLIHPAMISHQLDVGTRERPEEKANAHTYKVAHEMIQYLIY